MDYTQAQLDIKVTAHDIFGMGLCVAGIKEQYTKYVAKETGVSYREFIKNGTTTGALLKIDNAFARQVAQEMIARSTTHG